MTMARDYASDYAAAVVAGKDPASKKIIKACKRHLNDLKRQENDQSFNYIWLPQKGNNVIEFIEMLPDVNTGKPHKLANFQRFIVSMIYSWRRKDDHKRRRFNKAFISMARKNGKSNIVSGIMLYELLFGDNPKFNRQLYCAANSREQARNVFDMITATLKKIRSNSKLIRNSTKIIQNSIHHLPSDSVIKTLSKEAGLVNGFQPLIGVLDEYHESKTTEMINVLESGQTLLDNPLILIISTAGFDLNVPMYSQEYQYAGKILNGKTQDETYLALIWELDDPENEVMNKSKWIKSNPLLEVDSLREKMTDNLTTKLNEAIEKSDMNPVLVKNFNCWRQASKSSYIKADDWNACKVDESPNIDGRPCFIGLDLSRVEDLTAMAFIFPLEDKKFYVDCHVFVGTKFGLDQKIKDDKIDYRELARQGKATITDRQSGIINYGQVIDYMKDYISEHELAVQSVCYDPAFASLLISKNEDELDDLMLQPIRQDYMNLSPAVKNFRWQVMEKNIQHDGNPVLTMGVNNAIIKTDNNGNELLAKKTNRNKIDTIVAVINGFSEAQFFDFDSDLKYSTMNEYIMSDDFGF